MMFLFISIKLYWSWGGITGCPAEYNIIKTALQYQSDEHIKGAVCRMFWAAAETWRCSVVASVEEDLLTV